MAFLVLTWAESCALVSAERRAAIVSLRTSIGPGLTLSRSISCAFRFWHSGCFSALSVNSTRFHTELSLWERTMDNLIHMVPVVSAIGYSIVYLLAGGGVFGAF